ncbi:MAG: DUF2156 domain-containing protein [Thermoanaerobaculia bacterium]
MTQPRRIDEGPERRRALELLRRYGRNATSFQILEPDFKYWFQNDDTCVGYVDTGSAWVAAGAPVTAEENFATAVEGFVAAAAAEGRRVAFFAAESQLTETSGLAHLRIGVQPCWRPSSWREKIRRHRSLREQLRRARAKGLTVERLAPERVRDPAARSELDGLLDEWIRSRPMPPMAFLVDLAPFSFPEERRYFVARREGRVEGILVAVPIYQRKGWLFEDLLRRPGSPNGTTESLVAAAFEALAEEGSEHATLGLAPLAGDVGWLRWARDWMGGFYNFRGVYGFKQKFDPDEWEPVYLAWPRGRNQLMVLYDALAAFARGHVFRFAFSALFRAPSIVMRLLALLTIPWGLALVLAEPRWFPSRGVQISWFVFDLLVAAAFWILGRGWKSRLAMLVAFALTLDFTLTLMQILSFNAARVRSGGEWLVIVISLFGPGLAAAILWSGVWHRSR